MPNLISVATQCYRLGGRSIGSGQARNFSSAAPGNGEVLKSSGSSRIPWFPWDRSSLFSCFVYGALAQGGWEMYKMFKVKRDVDRRWMDYRVRSLLVRQEMVEKLMEKWIEKWTEVLLSKRLIQREIWMLFTLMGCDVITSNLWVSLNPSPIHLCDLYESKHNIKLI